MKTKFKIISAILIILIVVHLVGCMPKVENPITVLDKEIESVAFVFVGETEETLRVLEKDEISEFIAQLKTIPCYMITNDPPNVIENETIKLSLADGSYIMINYMNTATYNEGKIDHDAYYFKEEQFYDLWKKYINGSNSE